VPYFKVTERYALGGSTRIARRDLRAGVFTTAAEAVPGGVAVSATWPAPYAGAMRETYVSPSPGVLHVQSTIHLNDASAPGGRRSVSTLQVYGRRESRESLLRASAARNGDGHDVLRSFGLPV